MSDSYYSNKTVPVSEDTVPPPSYDSLYAASPSAPPEPSNDKGASAQYGTIDPGFDHRFNIPDAPAPSAPPANALPCHPPSRYRQAVPSAPSAGLAPQSQASCSFNRTSASNRCPARNVSNNTFDQIPHRIDINNTLRIAIHGRAYSGRILVRSLTSPDQRGSVETKVTARQSVASEISCAVSHGKDETTLDVNMPNSFLYWFGCGVRLEMTVWLPVSAKNIVFEGKTMEVELQSVAVENEINIKTANAPIRIQQFCHAQQLVLTTCNSEIDTRAANDVRPGQSLTLTTSNGNIHLGAIQADSSRITLRTGNNAITFDKMMELHCVQLDVDTSNANLDLSRVTIYSMEQVHIATNNGRIAVGTIHVKQGGLDVYTRNGQINVSEAKVNGNLSLSTSNSAITANIIHAHVANIGTSNSRIELDTVSVNKLVAKTSNSPITATLIHNNHVQAQLSTSNAKIQARLPANFVGAFEVKTSNSAAEVEGANVYLNLDEKSHKQGIVGPRPPPYDSGDVSLKTSNSKASLKFNVAL